MLKQLIPFRSPQTIGLQVKETAPEYFFLLSLLSDELETFNIAQVEVEEQSTRLYEETILCWIKITDAHNGYITYI